MRGLRIYVEGGGDGRAGKDRLRAGMGRFLYSLRDAAREKRLGWQVVACGSRGAAYSDFLRARETYPDHSVLLLCDAEGPVAGPAHAHLNTRDGWEVSDAEEGHLHLMVQQMEAWLVADPEGLRTFYGPRFRTSDLPRRRNVEEIPRPAL